MQDTHGAEEVAGSAVAVGSGGSAAARCQRGGARSGAGLHRAEEAAEWGFDARAADSAAAFVELMGTAVARTNEYVIEFECVSNPRMWVQWKGAMPPDWTALLRGWREVSG